MKLNIEELARSSFDPAIIDDGVVHVSELEAFDRLIVERCAQEAEELENTGNHIGECPASAWEQGTLDAAEGIRNLLED